MGQQPVPHDTLSFTITHLDRFAHLEDDQLTAEFARACPGRYLQPADPSSTGGLQPGLYSMEGPALRVSAAEVASLPWRTCHWHLGGRATQMQVSGSGTVGIWQGETARTSSAGASNTTLGTQCFTPP